MPVKKVLLWIILFLVISSISYALGVTPARKIVNFEPDAEYELQLKIRNKDSKDMAVLISAEGELSEYIDIPENIVTFTSDEAEKTIDYVLSLPGNFERPGTHKSELIISEHYSGAGRKAETAASVAVAIVSELWVRVPFPGKYAEAQLYISAKNTSEPVRFTIGITNFGKENIEKAKAKLRILDPQNNEVSAVDTNEISLKSKTTGELKAEWLPDVKPGSYHVVAEIIYDNKKLVLERDFYLGNLIIRIKSVSVKDFSLGQIAAFNILLESEWNELIPDVYSEITVLDKAEIAEIKTATVDIPPYGQGILKAYWDTEGVRVGEYKLRILIHYASRVTEKLIMAEVNIDSIRTDLGPTARVVAAPSTGRGMIFILLFIISIILNVIWFVRMRKSKKK